MRFLFNFLNARRGGRWTFLTSLLRVLDEEDADTCFVVVPGSVAGRLQGHYRRIHILTAPRADRSLYGRMLWEAVDLRKLVRDLDIDVYVGTANYAPFDLPCHQVLYVRNAGLFEPKTGMTPGGWSWLEHRVRRAVCRRSIEQADVVIVPSASMHRLVRDGVGRTAAGKVATVHHGFDSDRFGDGARLSPGTLRRLNDQLRPGAARVLYVSLYGPHKNFSVLLDACRRAEQRLGQPLDLLVTIERGDLSHAEEGTVFLGNVPHQDVHALLRLADVFAFPSRVESFGHPLVEAMAAGSAVIASDIPVCREVCDGAALYVRPDDVQGFADTIGDVLVDRKLRSELEARSRARASEFSWVSHWRRVREIVERAVETGGAR